MIDLVRNDVNRVYRGFNSDCGEGAARLSAPTLMRPSEADDFIRLSVDADKGDGFWDVLRLQDGLLLCVAEGVYSDPFRFFVSPPVDIISLRMILSGELAFCRNAGRAIHMKQGAMSLLRQAQAGDCEFHILEKRPLASVTLHFHADRFAALMGLDEGALPAMLAPFSDSTGGYNYCEMPMTPAMVNGVIDIIKAPYTGMLRRRYFEAKTLELMCLVADAAQCGDGEAQPALHAPAAAYVQLAARTLEENLAEPPTVDQLARRVGVNRTRLRQDFKRIYGQTISEFIQVRRMDRARALLREDGASISAVAEAVGYRHAGNFTSAFRRRFGVAPKDIKRRH